MPDSALGALLFMLGIIFRENSWKISSLSALFSMKISRARKSLFTLCSVKVHRK